MNIMTCLFVKLFFKLVMLCMPTLYFEHVSYSKLRLLLDVIKIMIDLKTFVKKSLYAQNMCFMNV